MSASITLIVGLLFATAGISAASSAHLLRAFQSCTELHNFYIRNALMHVGPYGLPPYAWTPMLHSRGPLLNPGVDFSDSVSKDLAGEEPTYRKRSGDTIFEIRGKKMHIFNATSARPQHAVLGSIRLPRRLDSLIVQGQSVIVIATDVSLLVPKFPSQKLPSWRRFQFETIVYQVNVKSNTPVLTSTLSMHGRLISARKINGIIKFVLDFDPTTLLTLQEVNKRFTKKESLKLNMELVRGASYNLWTPKYNMTTMNCNSKGCESTTTSGVLTKCNRIYYPPNEFPGFAYVNAVNVRVKGALKVLDGAATLTDPLFRGSQGFAARIYSTTKSLYVTTAPFKGDHSLPPANDERRGGRQYRTGIHKFVLEDRKIIYAGSAELQGRPLTFSMHEHNGILYTANTLGARWWNKRNESNSKITAFRDNEQSLELVRVGEVGNLSAGQYITTVRYIRATAFVEMRQDNAKTQKIRLVDISNPKRMHVGSWLDPHSSRPYMHPIAPGKLLVFGVQSFSTPYQIPRVRLFNITDVSNAITLRRFRLKKAVSNFVWYHNTFRYCKDSGIAIVRFSAWIRNRHHRISIGLKVSDEKISSCGQVAHTIRCEEACRPGAARKKLALAGGL